MTSSKNIIWAVSGLTVIFILIAAVIIKIAGTYNEKLFFGLLATLAFLVVTIYFIRRKKQVAVRDYYLFNKEGHSYPSQIKELPHLINPIKIQEKDLKVSVGNSRCSQPYHASILNTAILNNNVLNKFFIPPVTRKSEPFSLDERIIEDEISTYFLNTEDLVWQIGPEYLGCRKEYGNFNAVQFKKNALRPNVKMIELKLSGASNSGYCSVLPGYSADIKNGIPANQGVSPLGHTAFRCAEGMILFVGKLQELSGGKPVGFRLFIDDKKEFYEICYAIRKTQIIPDFIVVDSLDDATTSGISLYEALQFVSKTLQHYGLDKEIKIIAAGKVISGFDVLKMIAMGADAVCTLMPSYNMSNYQDPHVEKFRNDTIKAMINIMKVCGFKNRNDITLAKLFSQLDMLPLKATEGSYNHKTNMGSVKIMNQSYIKLKGNTARKHAAVQ